MAYVESALFKLNKEDLIRIALDMQKSQKYILPDMKIQQSVLRKNYRELEADLNVSK